MARKKLPTLSAMQTTIIAATMRNRVVTPPTITTMVPGHSEEAKEKALRRLNHGGWLDQIQLPDRRSCYTLSREAVLTLGLSKKALKAMGREAVVTNLAMTCFCAKHKIERLTPDEVHASFPELDRPGLQLGNYFTDTSTNPPRLTWMMVDRGLAPDVIVRKVGKIVTKAHRSTSLVSLMHSGQYAIVILVPNDRKKWLVERILAKRFFPHVTVTVSVVPEIQNLLLS